MTDRHVDTVLAYFEAICWRKIDSGKMQPSCSPAAVFRQRGYWAHKNTNQETSRDRYTGNNLAGQIAALESDLGRFGFGSAYCEGIRKKAAQGRTDARGQHLYKAALERTLRAKRKQFSGAVLAR
jgi:hypothetical protein